VRTGRLGDRLWRVVPDRGLLTLLMTVAATVPASGTAQASWEFKVCAHPDNYPASSFERPGYENEIAEILADELGAELVFEWTTLDRDSIVRRLHGGACDAVVGIGESVTEVESTVPFLRAPYTFVSRAKDELEVTSLDDPALAQLTIGTYPSGVPSRALASRGLQDNLREYPPVASPSGLDRHAAILDALIEGQVDIAIVYGPAASARAELEPGLLRIVPVTPETDLTPSVLHMFRIFTIGVRPHDTVFRERLNTAMAARWDEIQAAIAGYGVDQLELQRPPVARKDVTGTIRVGVVVPSETSDYHPYQTAGEAARRGAELAENYIARFVEPYDVQFEVLTASAPNDEAAVRAVERLATVEDVIAFVGGFGRAQAEELSRIAAERDLVFFNVGASDDALRGEQCRVTTFHVEASASMYADAAIAWYTGQGLDDWYLIHEATESGEELAEHVRARLAGQPSPAKLVGASAVEPGQLVYVSEIQAIREAAPDVVLLQLGAEELHIFYGQLQGQRVEAVVTAVPEVRAQTREFLYRFSRAAPDFATAPRPALWETSVAEGEAGEINEGYTSRAGDPMEPSAWAAYTAVLFTFEAAAANAAGDAVSLVEFLSDPETSLDLGKGEGVSFRAWDHQLRQPLYMVQVDPDAAWGRRLSPRLALARAVGVVPEMDTAEDPRQVLDQLGTGPERSECRFWWARRLPASSQGPGRGGGAGAHLGPPVAFPGAGPGLRSTSFRACRGDRGRFPVVTDRSAIARYRTVIVSGCSEDN
jgi:ABC-type branched-subunit amino acid transport system substrate-binding protein/ABC-type amino acid transport substrate-binding protein